MKAALIAAILFAALPLSAWSQAKPLPQPSSMPEALSQAEFSRGMSGIRPKIDACAAKTQAQGTVTVAVKVTGSGNVEDVKVTQTPDAALAVCVAAAAQKATFSRSMKGGKLSHSFRF